MIFDLFTNFAPCYRARFIQIYILTKIITIMKQKLLLKTMLLLCALIVGEVSSAWATDYVKVTSASDLVDGGVYVIAEISSDTKYLVTGFGTKLQNTTSGFTVSDNTITTTSATPLEFTLGTVTSGNNTYYTLQYDGSHYLGYSGSSTNFETATTTTNSKEQWSISPSTYAYSILNVNTSNRYIGRNGSNIGPYSTSNSYPNCYLFKKQSPTTYTVSYAANGGTGTMTDTSSPYAAGAEVTLLSNTFTAPTGKTWSSWAVTDASSNTVSVSNGKFTMPASNVTVTAQWADIPSYTITAQSNNTSYGTVSLEGNVITGNPASGYRYANPAYTVSSGSATVVQNGNEFTVTPSSDCTVTINFEAIPTHTVTYSVNGVTARQDFAEGAAITFPSNPADISGKKFVGWAETSISGTINTAPTFVTSATMGNSDIIYYAVFADVTGTTAASWTETAIGNISSSDVIVISDGSYAMNNDNGTSNPPSANSISVSGTSLSVAPNDNLKWNVSGNATDGYTFYPNGTTSTWLYCNTTASSSSNNNIRVGTGNRKVWKFNNNGYLVTNDDNTARYLSIYVENNAAKDFRGYTGTGNGAFVPKFYKYIAGSATYGNYCTTVVVTYSVTYDANGATSGDVPTDATAYSPNAEVTVLGNTGNLAKTGYAFGGWNTLANGEGTNYAADATFSITGNTTLYAKWTPYTITAASNNNSYGTVELSGNVITATPASGYTYASPAYTVSSGTATVVQNGNEFTVTPTSDCTVTINFAAIPTHTATFSVNGATTSNTFYEGQAIAFPNVPAVGGYDFIGWATAEITGTAATAPTTVTAATMGTADITYYAVYGDVENVTATFDASDISNLTSTATNTWTDNETGIVLEISDGQRYTGASPYTWTVTKSTSSADYCLTIGRENCQLKKVKVTVSASDYSVGDYYAYEKYNDETGIDKTETVSTNELVSTLTLVGSYELVALWSSTTSQIRATKIEVEADLITAYMTTLPTYSVTISNFGWATYIAEKNVYFDSNVSAYIATGNSGNSVTLTEVAAVEKGTPVVVKAKNAIENSETFTLETVDADDCDDVSANLLEVCDGTAAEDGYNYFVLAKNEGSACFKQWTGQLSSLNGRVVLPLQLDLTTQQGNARALTIVFSGESTGISTIEHSPLTIDRYYNLKGQRVDTPKKGGLYIMNGKKVVIK